MRQMTVIAQDPCVRSRGKTGPILMARISVPAEDLIPGPIGYRLQIVDYDSTIGRFNDAHTLPRSLADEPPEWWAGNLNILKDYRFHAQNVYALVMKTLARFQFALGRRVGWSFKTHQLKVAPHGMLDANAFYSPRDEGLVFGYFLGKSGTTVYTCLSHDVVVHETAHALIDALRERYLDPSSADQAAFHEGLADVVALLSVFSQPELTAQLLSLSRASSDAPKALISKKRLSADALKQSALFGLAEQMGEEIQGSRGGALRHSASLSLTPAHLTEAQFMEPHRRGEILCAAVMNGFINAWAARISSSEVPGQKFHPIVKVAEEGADIADALATMWIRALDYMPPVHLEFRDALSAALTADLEMRPDDTRFDLRKHIIDAFGSLGILPASAGRRGSAGAWERGPGKLRYDRVRFESMRSDKDEVFRFLRDNHRPLEIRPGAYTEVLSVRPCARTGLDGFTLHETVAEYYQVARLTPGELGKKKITAPKEYLEALRKEKKASIQRRRRQLAAAVRPEGSDAGNEASDTDDGDVVTPLYGGGVLIFDEYGRLKYHVRNDVFGRKRQGKRLKYLWETGQLELRRDEARLRPERLSTIHRLRALDARRFPAQGW
jgi:hypothetical protein